MVPIVALIMSAAFESLDWRSLTVAGIAVSLLGNVLVLRRAWPASGVPLALMHPQALQAGDGHDRPLRGTFDVRLLLGLAENPALTCSPFLVHLV